MKKALLFISNGRITDPIIHSQGLPLLKSLAATGFICNFISFDHSTEEVAKSTIKNKYKGSITFHDFDFKNIRFVPNWLSSFYLRTIQVKRIIEDQSISILHCRSLFPGIIALFVKMIYNNEIKIIYDNRGVYIDEEIYKGHWKSNGSKEIITRKLEKLLLKNCTAQVVVSDFFKSYIVNKNILNITDIESKTFVITNGTKINERQILQKDKNSIVGVFLGSAAKWQNLDGVVALMKISQRLPNFLRYKIISYNIEAYEKVIEQSGLDRSRIEIKNLESHEIQKSIETCSFGILIREDNLINNVATPLKFAEYLSAGLPILISKGIGDTEEIIKKYNVGVVVENELYEEGLIDLIELLKNDDIHKRCMDVAKTEFNIDNSFEKYKMIYKKIVNNKL